MISQRLVTESSTISQRLVIVSQPLVNRIQPLVNHREGGEEGEEEAGGDRPCT